MGADTVRVSTAGAGLLLVLFLVVHLAGLSLAPPAPSLFETYASELHRAPWLPVAELTLLAAALAHLALGLTKVITNRRAGNDAALRSRRGDPLAALAARSQAAGGVLLLAFLLVHLLQLRCPRPPAGQELAVLQALLRQPLNLALYLGASLAVGLHLFHGAEAAHRSLGWLQPGNGPRIRRAGRALAVVVGGGFAAVTLLLALPAALEPSLALP
jgi:succinate dehydrogenase / fumarate reductase cytochrome b subunit